MNGGGICMVNHWTSLENYPNQTSEVLYPKEADFSYRTSRMEKIAQHAKGICKRAIMPATQKRWEQNAHERASTLYNNTLQHAVVGMFKQVVWCEMGVPLSEVQQKIVTMTAWTEKQETAHV